MTITHVTEAILAALKEIDNLKAELARANDKAILLHNQQMRDEELLYECYETVRGEPWGIEAKLKERLGIK
jgi:hypothetical protein